MLDTNDSYKQCTLQVHSGLTYYTVLSGDHYTITWSGGSLLVITTRSSDLVVVKWWYDVIQGSVAIYKNWSVSLPCLKFVRTALF